MERSPAPGGTLIRHALSAALTCPGILTLLEEDSDICLAAAGLEGLLGKYSGHGGGRRSEEN